MRQRGVRAPRRKLSPEEDSYLEERRLYEGVLQLVVLVSANQHGISTDGRGIRAFRVFTRQTLTAISLESLLPRPSREIHEEEELWDVCSIASLARGLVEGYLCLQYYGLELVSDDEADLRYQLLQLHRNTELYEIRKTASPGDPALDEFKHGIPEQRERIRAHRYMERLSGIHRERVLRGLEMYYTKSDFEGQFSACRGLRQHYRHLSNLAHALPLSIERIDNERGRGIGSAPEITHCMTCMMLARRYLAASIVDLLDRFQDVLGSRFRSQLEEVRPLQERGF